ncbi:protein-export chaperone SecB [Candidatus Pantoea edessiphila]|uniref:Protein-export protein SecB n=1 Tax=Candidatus Pantoea edessiphila TaxID=2044610 RepID=A0A2P5T0B3_9GAMM|nr:protein-export chaperone SecB [Candidatus Pantoea edessiphila]PPI88034.1 protein-export chaperone SecB [Candidatus Pantoea edessiphila]
MLDYKFDEMRFHIQRIYIKDISFEAPNTPQIFQKDWNSKLELNIDTFSNQLSNEIFEVVLRLTVTANIDKDIAFLCEVKQAGIFNIIDIPDLYKTHFLRVYCPNILFPYGSECISNLVTRGTFPQTHLTPINFDELLKNKISIKEK